MKKGQKATKEQLEQMRQNALKMWQDPEYRQHMSDIHKGHIHTEEQKRKISEKLMGHPVSDKAKRAISHANRDEGNGMWKGDDVSYIPLHAWVKLRLGKANHCDNNINHMGSFVWANISGNYKRDLTDWHQLCNSCNQTDGIHMHPRFNIKSKKKK